MEFELWKNENETCYVKDFILKQGDIVATKIIILLEDLEQSNFLDLDSFATTPQIMKSIALWMNAQIQKYKESFGVIDMTPPQISSPIQIADLKKPGDEK